MKDAIETLELTAEELVAARAKMEELAGVSIHKRKKNDEKRRLAQIAIGYLQVAESATAQKIIAVLAGRENIFIGAELERPNFRDETMTLCKKLGPKHNLDAQALISKVMLETRESLYDDSDEIVC